MTLEIWSEEVCSWKSRSLKSVQGFHRNGIINKFWFEGKMWQVYFLIPCCHCSVRTIFVPRFNISCHQIYAQSAVTVFLDWNINEREANVSLENPKFYYSSYSQRTVSLQMKIDAWSMFSYQCRVSQINLIAKSNIYGAFVFLLLLYVFPPPLAPSYHYILKAWYRSVCCFLCLSFLSPLHPPPPPPPTHTPYHCPNLNCHSLMQWNESNETVFHVHRFS